MISHKYKCIFIHQRKTAGLSILSTFKMPTDDPDHVKFNDGVLSLKAPAWEPDWAEEHENYEDYFVFTVVRNPWDRFVSGWKYCESTRDRSLLDVARSMPPLHPDYPAHGHDYRHLTRTQTATLLDDQGNLVTDYVVRFEDLQTGFDHVCDQIGKKRVKLPWRNPTKHKPYTEYYDDESRDLVARAFEKDINTFGYVFGHDAECRPTKTKNARRSNDVNRSNEPKLNFLQKLSKRIRGKSG